MITAAVYAILGALLWLLPPAALLVIFIVLGCALQRNWPRVPSRLRGRRVPSRNPDGRPLTVPERERFGWIEAGYKIDAREPGRRR